jgi:hypothetical protein
VSASEIYRPSYRCLSPKLIPTFVDRGCHVVSFTAPYSCILSFLDWSRYLFFQVAPQLYSQGWVDPVPDPLLHRKSGSAENRTRSSGYIQCCEKKHKLWKHSRWHASLSYWTERHNIGLRGFISVSIFHRDLPIDAIVHPTISISRSIFTDKAFFFVKDPGNVLPLPSMWPLNQNSVHGNWFTFHKIFPKVQQWMCVIVQITGSK